MLVAATVAVLISAFLLFFLEPMFARMVLPKLGGSPAVWNTALVFYQLTLLAGYGYVHWTTTRLGVRRQAVLHLLVMMAALVALPIAVPRGWQPPANDNPIPWLLALLAVAVGLPLFVVSTTGPLMQRWFAATSHRRASDPYFLYSASNLGSLAGLLSYPILWEPRLALAEQGRLWSWGYVALTAVTLICAIAMRRATLMPALAAAAPGLPSVASPAPGEAPTPGTRLRWVLLALAPSSLMMGVTTHISTEIASIPLLWVLPLALYLATFILTFSRRPLFPHALMVRAMPLIVLPLVIAVLSHAVEPVVPITCLHLLALFVLAMVCHGELSRTRPPVEHLTEFYLWLAVGGSLGGIVNAIVAPLVFRTIVEYPLAVVLACVLAPSRATTISPRARVLDFVLPLVVLALGWGVAIGVAHLGAGDNSRRIGVTTAALLTFPVLSFSRRPLRFGLGVAALLLLNPDRFQHGTTTIERERSFFGTHRVVADSRRGLHLLYHGTTLHGIQSTSTPREPLGYYTREGPFGDVFTAMQARGARSIAVMGLGAGGVGGYAAAGQRWTFFEIDPVVQRIANDPRDFTYLRDSPAKVRVVLGDARLSLAGSHDRFDVIVLDAYSSDAIPVHLLTREALALYLDRLAPGGVLLFHISNRHFRLAPVVARLALDAGLCARTRHFEADARQIAMGVLPSECAVLARRCEDLGAIETDPRWQVLRVPEKAPLWRDDFSSLWSVLRH
jgi:hypothetical protein